MKTAIAQTPMHWTPGENLQCILEHLTRAQRLGANLVLFPECALTGYHRRVPEHASPYTVDDALRRIRAACADLRIAAVVGTPFYPDREAGCIWNAAVAISDRGGILAVVPKAGLTRSETRYFRPGTDRPLFTVAGATCGVILCREVRDVDALRDSLRGADLVLWPGAVWWEGREEDAPPADRITLDDARACARALGAYLIQCNWPQSLNRPELTGWGGSVVISPDGEVVYRCLPDEAGMAVLSMSGGGEEVEGYAASVPDHL